MVQPLLSHSGTNDLEVKSVWKPPVGLWTTAGFCLLFPLNCASIAPDSQEFTDVKSAEVASLIHPVVNVVPYSLVVIPNRFGNGFGWANKRIQVTFECKLNIVVDNSQIK